MARICLLSPGHLSTNPRLVKEADALTDAGHEVALITGDYSLWAREADKTITARSRVVQSLCFGPQATLPRRIFQFLRVRAARMLVAAGLRDPAVVRAAWHPIAPDLVAAAKRVKADLYVAHYPAALPAAAIAGRLHGALYAFDAEDFHLGDPPDDIACASERRMVRAIEERYLPGCTYVTAASPGIADAYVSSYRIERPTVVLNVLPRARVPTSGSPKGTADPTPSIYWFSQTIGPDRGLECAVRAIGRARSQPHLYLRGSPAAGFLALLRRIAAEVGAADRLHVLPPGPPSEMVRLAAVYDLGLSGEPGHTPNNRIALGNKLFTYLLAGLPIVASKVPSHVSFAAEVGCAMRLYAVDDADELAAALDGLFEDPCVFATARAAALALGQTRYNWDVEKSVLLTRVAASLSNGGLSVGRVGARN
jgi:glycosyltransferase involved in cell wall biosynthesis